MGRERQNAWFPLESLGVDEKESNLPQGIHHGFGLSLIDPRTMCMTLLSTPSHPGGDSEPQNQLVPKFQEEVT